MIFFDLLFVFDTRSINVNYKYEFYINIDEEPKNTQTKKKKTHKLNNNRKKHTKIVNIYKLFEFCISVSLLTNFSCYILL